MTMITPTDKITTLAAYVKQAHDEYAPLEDAVEEQVKHLERAKAAAGSAYSEWIGLLRGLESSVRRLYDTDRDAALAITFPFTERDLPRATGNYGQYDECPSIRDILRWQYERDAERRVA